MERYTRKNAERSLERLMTALGKHPTKFNHSAEDVGTYYLDYNATYGGCRINEVINDGYGVAMPFGSTRCTPYEFCQRVDFALSSIKQPS